MMVFGLPSSTRNAPPVPLRCPVTGWLAELTPGTRPRPTLPRMAGSPAVSFQDPPGSPAVSFR